MLILSCSSNVAPCPSGSEVWVSTTDAATLADIGITSDQIFSVMTWGFGVVLLGFILGWGLGLALGLIRKV